MLRFAAGNSKPWGEITERLWCGIQLAYIWPSTRQRHCITLMISPNIETPGACYFRTLLAVPRWFQVFNLYIISYRRLKRREVEFVCLFVISHFTQERNCSSDLINPVFDPSTVLSMKKFGLPSHQLLRIFLFVINCDMQLKVSILTNTSHKKAL